MIYKSNLILYRAGSSEYRYELVWRERRCVVFYSKTENINFVYPRDENRYTGIVIIVWCKLYPTGYNVMYVGTPRGTNTHLSLYCATPPPAPTTLTLIYPYPLPLLRPARDHSAGIREQHAHHYGGEWHAVD